MISMNSPLYNKPTYTFKMQHPKTYAKTVIKRNGHEVPVAFDKVTRRIKALSHGLCVEPSYVTQEVIVKMSDRMHVRDIDELAAQEAAFMIKMHLDYLTLAGRLVVSNLHKETPSCFSEAMEIVHYQNFEPPAVKDNEDHFLSKDFMAMVRKHAKVLDAAIVHNADYSFDYFGMSTLLNGYLNKVTDAETRTQKVVERPQYMFMRVALFLNMDNIPMALTTYKLLSEKFYTHASPTLFNAGKPKSQNSSCYLLQIPEDSLDSIYDTLKQCALISKHAGGIGISVHKIRAEGAIIKSSGGLGDGLVPMLRVVNDTARYVNQGGKRKGAFAVYLEPWHADIKDWLDLKKNRGNEECRARDLHYGLWIPDLFMTRVENDQNWSLFSPDTAPGLSDVWGDTFKTLYEKYEQENKAFKIVKARALWQSILESQIETGEPYMLYKDACNGKSNQQNLGTIQSSNLCCEIIEYTSKDEVAVCNLLSLCLPTFVVDGKFDHDKLFEVVKVGTRNLNKVIDLNYYPISEAKNSNSRHRPIGMGIQGLADTFCMLMYAYDGPEAKQLNRDIFETIYFGAVTASVELAKEHGVYSTYEGSPASKGLLQYDLWGVKPSGRWDWATLKQQLKLYGLRNSLLVAPMPTASTSQIMGFNESFEPFTRNLYVRRTDAGEFLVINQHLARLLSQKGLWTNDIIDQIIAHNGSVQFIDAISSEIKNVFKTAFEIKTKVAIDMAADRGAFICQSQSMNVFIESPTPQILNSVHMYGWKKGLKTGMYYLRTKSKSSAQQVTLDPETVKKAKEDREMSEKSTGKLPTIMESSEEYKNDTDSGRSTLSSLESGSSKTYVKNGKTYICNDDVCISCGS